MGLGEGGWDGSQLGRDWRGEDGIGRWDEIDETPIERVLGRCENRDGDNDDECLVLNKEGGKTVLGRLELCVKLLYSKLFY